jgi:hypothetical protein
MSVARRKRPLAEELDTDQDSASAGGRPVRPDEMSDEVIEFIQAIDQYKRLQQRPFPSWSEVLEVLKSLGYAKQD